MNVHLKVKGEGKAIYPELPLQILPQYTQSQEDELFLHRHLRVSKLVMLGGVGGRGRRGRGRGRRGRGRERGEVGEREQRQVK